MLRVMKLLLVAALLWSMYWFAAGWGLRSGISSWFSEQQRQGWQAEYGALNSSGYPSHHVTRISQPTLADPGTGTAWRADWLEIESPAIWPGRQTLRFAPTPQRLSYFDQTVVIEAQALQARLHLAPGLALGLEEMALNSATWRISDGAKTIIGAETLQLAMRQTAQPERYQLLIDATGFTPGTELRQLMAAADTLPDSFDALSLDMEVTFDTAWDRSALELRRPQPRHITLRLADAHWGALRLKATGTLEVNEAGLPTGEISLKVENWRQMLAMAEGAGALPATARDGIERVLGLFAGLGGTPNDLDTQLNFRNGYIALGPIPLGAAPRLILR
ncbi:DUF2125 domain-containing protein [Parasedimentitalea psychrophila]|uniref:DUF2125 domain-containing protein n=1 Tax=Parasedimentitalea psychrophila TaxID=2997337 RepID=A0A9Y2P0Q5_9RHOB|nr:DUF2125 domain-containing protein [Parasedimentitalea psychrophila]WIY23387.1 DUF2125 domain-containing protein [Parasedimentitalea psychrophila]